MLLGSIFEANCVLVLSVKRALRDLSCEQSLFVCVVSQRLDVEKETIELVHTKPTETQELPYRIPTDSPRYHFFIFKHSHQGQLQEALGQYTVSINSNMILPFSIFKELNGAPHAEMMTHSKSIEFVFLKRLSFSTIVPPSASHSMRPCDVLTPSFYTNYINQYSYV